MDSCFFHATKRPSPLGLEWILVIHATKRSSLRGYIFFDFLFYQMLALAAPKEKRKSKNFTQLVFAKLLR
jgi:hypothetical protein